MAGKEFFWESYDEQKKLWPVAGRHVVALKGRPRDCTQVRQSEIAGHHCQVGLHLQNFLSRGPASDGTCSAADPGSKLDFEVTVAGRVLYMGSLAGFAATYSGSARQLPIPGRSGGWARGDQVRVTLAVRLDASADNSYMGCTTDTDFVWLAA